MSSPTFADLGERIGSMLGLADEEATSIRAAAAAEVEQARHAADEDAALVRAEADRYAEEVRSRADVDASEAVSRAKQEADSIIDDAAREAAARREEAEAYYEKQRATAAASAADFERTLGERREKSAAEFTAQMAQQDQALAAVQERADLLGREAEEDRQSAAAEASRTLEAARVEAAALVGSAKEHAERIRRDSERELAAATARRDSITAQLSNVRNMLATLGGGAAVGLLGRGRAPGPGDRRAGRAPVEEAATQEHVEAEVHDEADAVDAPEQDAAETAVDATDEGAEGDEIEAVDAELETDDASEPVEEPGRRTRPTPATEPGTPKGPTTSRGGALRSVLTEPSRSRTTVESRHASCRERHPRAWDLVRSDRGSWLEPGPVRGGAGRRPRRRARPRAWRPGRPRSTASDPGAGGAPCCRRGRRSCRCPTSLTTSRSQPLRASLARPWSSTEPSSSPVSAANPTMTGDRALPRAAHQPGEHVGVAHQLDDRRRVVGGTVGPARASS